MQCLRKVDFFWINRDQKSFEWFLKLLTVMEAEQQEEEANQLDNDMGRYKGNFCILVQLNIFIA